MDDDQLTPLNNNRTDMATAAAPAATNSTRRSSRVAERVQKKTSAKKNEPGQIVTLTNQFNYKQVLSSSDNIDKDYNEFLIAVKKILK